MIKRIRFPFAKSDREIPRAELIWARAAYLAAKFATLTIGAAYVSPRVAALRRRRDRGALRPVFSGRVALIAHAYYVDLIDEILACYAVLPADTDLIVTTPPDKYSDALEKLAHVERVRLFNVPNRGRDIAPFLKLLDRKSTRLNSSHSDLSRMPSSA